MDLDAGLRFRFRVGIAADMRAAIEHQNPLIQLRCHTLGNRQAEETGTDDKEIETSCHRQQGYPTATAQPESDGMLRSRLAHNSASSL